MNWYLIVGITISIIILIYRAGKQGNTKFWKYVNKNPTAAYAFFMSNDCWHVIHPNEFKTKPKDGDWSGPFFVPVPGIGRLKVYGKEDEFENKQQEFIEMIEKG